jgi:hypothetical protein
MRDRIRRNRFSFTSATIQFGHALQSLAQNRCNSRHHFALPGLDHGGGSQGEQAHHGANLEPPGATVGKAQDVVVETILLVPHAFRPCLIHGAGDPKKMIGKFCGHVLV